MIRLYLALGALTALSLSFVWVDRAAYNRGVNSAKTSQVVADAAAYQKIIKEMGDAGIDVSNPDAVDCELRRLAGEPDDTQCGDM